MSLISWAQYPVLGDPMLYILRVFRNLPESAASLREKRRQATALGAMQLVFKAHRQRDWPSVRQGLRVGIINDPRWLRNPGVISIGAESLLGRRIMTVLRNAAKRAVGRGARHLEHERTFEEGA